MQIVASIVKLSADANGVRTNEAVAVEAIVIIRLNREKKV